MIYTSLTNLAMRVAYKAHHGQVDKAGVPYVFHPYHLAEQMKDETTVCVALLHDVLEDGGVSLEELSSLFPERVITPLKLLTHEKGTDYFEYIRLLKDHPVAKEVKLADLSHNMVASRLANVPDVSDEEQNRLRAKYERALAILMDDDF